MTGADVAQLLFVFLQRLAVLYGISQILLGLFQLCGGIPGALFQRGQTLPGGVSGGFGGSLCHLCFGALGCQVEWDPYLRGATVTSPGAAYDAGELYWLSRIICAESGAESMSGQIAVGNVILNRVRSGSFPNTVEGVIFDRKDAVQFEPVSNGRVYLPPTSQSVEAAKRALDGENVVGSALYFYAPALSQGTWINANRPYQQTIGCHRFYR